MREIESKGARAPERNQQAPNEIDRTRRKALIAAVGVAAACGAPLLHAQDYPDRPVRLVVPFAPGGPSDTQARMFAQKLQDDLKQNVIIDNKPGGAGHIGVELVVRSPADGYTLLFCSTGPLVINPALFERMPFDTFKDLAPVALMSSAPTVLAVNPSFPAQNIGEFLALTRANPDKYSYASGGEGTTQHLSGALLNSLANLRLTHVPYKGEGPAVSDALAGHVPIIFTGVGTGLPHFKAGRLRPLAVTSPKRNPALPDVPTMIEAGLAGYEITSWQGILVPAGTPQAIVQRLNEALNRVLKAPDIAERLISQGNVPGGGTAADFGNFMVRESQRWGSTVKAAGLGKTR